MKFIALPGVYMVNQVSGDYNQNIASKVSYNKGSEWFRMLNAEQVCYLSFIDQIGTIN